MKHNMPSISLATLLVLPATCALAQVPAQAPAQAAGQASAPAKVVSETQVPAAAQAKPDAAKPGQIPGQIPGQTRGSKTVKQGKGTTPPGMPMRGMGAPPAPPKPAWLSFKLNPKTKMLLDFSESNPDMVISMFSRTSGITILKDPSFKINLTMASANAVSLKDAFEIFNTVLNLNGYELQKRGNLLLVARFQPPQPPPSNFVPPPQPVPVIKTYPLLHANAGQVARVVNEIFAAGAPAGGQQGGNPFGGGPNFGGVVQFGGGQPNFGGGGQPGKAPVKATSEDYSNAVIVRRRYQLTKRP